MGYNSQNILNGMYKSSMKKLRVSLSFTPIKLTTVVLTNTFAKLYCPTDSHI